MTSRERSLLEVCYHVANFNINHIIQLQFIPEYTIEQKVFDNALNSIDAELKLKREHKKAKVTETLYQQTRTIMTTTVIKYALRSAVKAKQVDKMVLGYQLDKLILQISENFQTDLLLQYIKEVVDILRYEESVLTNITTDNFTEMATVIDEYEKMRNNPLIKMQAFTCDINKHSHHIPQLLQDALSAINNMQKLIISYYADSDEALIEEFKFSLVNISINKFFHSLSKKDERKKENKIINQ